MKRVKNIFQDETKRSILLLVISGIALFLNLLHIAPVGLNLAWIAIILCGLPIIKEAIIGLVTEFDIKADVLVAIALVASVLIGETFAAGEVAFIMQLGALLEDLTVAKARAGIEKLVHLTPQTARVISNGEEKVISTDEVKVGDTLRVKPGEIIPADGIITSGVTSINQAVMTGESIPVDKTIGDYVSSGTVNQFGSFLMEAKKVGEDSSLQRMIKLVQSADAGKAKIVGIADRWATWIVCIALSSALLTWIITGEIIRAVTILVVFCPCALVLATPTAIMAAIGNVSKYGILVREGDALERLSKVTKITFDKTGTLTKGKPIVVAIKSIDNNFTENQLYSYLASAEIYSEHPLGKAIVECYRETTKETINEPEEFKMYPGRGVSIQIDGKLIYAGNEEFMVDNKILLSLINDMVTQFQNEGATIIYIAINQEIKGFVALADTLREDVSDTITSLHKTKVETVLLTGDNQFSAEHIASNAGITNIYANCLPEDKLNAIKEIQNNGDMVCMVGDGINDAPALKTALVGIAMGGEGSDIAVDAADIVLVRDDITKLPHLFQLSKHMMKTIKLNMIFSMALNFAAIILAITGILNPVVGALVHNAGSIVVIVNSSLLLKWKHSMNE
ncbi:MAG: lead, cadmium, zinc and mercury transporting ATPase [Anaerocolumna sp.]|nr:lead, cadmium, zinc and mercury transporting ATPase [Anaerocolumna sp.]